MIPKITNTRVIKPASAGALKSIPLSPFNSFALGKDYFPRLQKLFQDKFGITVKDAFVDNRAKIGIIAMDPSFIDTLEATGDFSANAFSDFTILLEPLEAENEVNLYFLRPTAAITVADAAVKADAPANLNITDIKYCMTLLDIISREYGADQAQMAILQIVYYHDQPDGDMPVRPEKLDLFEKIVSACIAKGDFGSLIVLFERSKSYMLRAKALEGFYLFFRRKLQINELHADSVALFFQSANSTSNQFFKIVELFQLRTGFLAQDINRLFRFVPSDADSDSTNMARDIFNQVWACLENIFSGLSAMLGATLGMDDPSQEIKQKKYVVFLSEITSALKMIPNILKADGGSTGLRSLISRISFFCEPLTTKYKESDPLLHSTIEQIGQNLIAIRNSLAARQEPGPETLDYDMWPYRT
jgi:hypothetical protein